MASPDQKESFGSRVLGGLAWGIGFTVVAVPLGLILHSLLDDSFKGDDDEDWREHFDSRREYLEWQLENEIRRTGEPDKED